MHNREGGIDRIIATCILDDGRRAWGDSTDEAMGRDMCANEWVGKRVRLDASGTLLA